MKGIKDKYANAAIHTLVEGCATAVCYYSCWQVGLPVKYLETFVGALPGETRRNLICNLIGERLVDIKCHHCLICEVDWRNCL